RTIATLWHQMLARLCIVCNRADSQKIESQQLAGNLAVEQRNPGNRWHSNESDQTRIPRKYESRPARTALAKSFPESSIERSQILFLTDSLAVGRIADDHSRRSRRWTKLSDIANFELNQVSDAGGAGVASRKGDGILPNIETR